MFHIKMNNLRSIKVLNNNFLNHFILNKKSFITALQIKNAYRLSSFLTAGQITRSAYAITWPWLASWKIWHAIWCSIWELRKSYSKWVAYHAYTLPWLQPRKKWEKKKKVNYFQIKIPIILYPVCFKFTPPCIINWA